MVPIAQEDVLRVIFYSYSFEQLGLNIRHYIVGEITGDLTDKAVAEVMAEDAKLLYAPLMHTAADFIGVSVERIAPTAAPISYSSRVDYAGTATGGPLPLETAGLISLRTQQIGPGGKGRMYIPFPAFASMDTDGHPKQQYVDDLRQLAIFMSTDHDIVEDINSTVITPVISSTTPSGYPVVDDYVVRRLWASSRRRGDFAKRNIPPF